MGRQRVLGLVLAGGAGTRLGPLTADRAKSAVPFGGLYRVVDFALSNLVNGGLQRICVLTQYKSHSLNKHITTTWRLSTLLDNYVTPVPAQQRLGPHWQAGSADAIYESLNLIHADRPDIVVVVGADHVYRMDPRQMIEAHLAWGTGATVAAIPVPRHEATDFGVVQTAPDGHRIEVFLEKPAHPPSRPGQPDETLVSMGNYVFDTEVLVEALSKDAADEDSRHSMGGDIIPRLVRERAAHVYDFLQNKVPGAEPRDAGYWREVGTLDSYFDAHMDLCAVRPGVQPVQPTLADPDPCAAATRRPSSCTTTASCWARRSTAWSATASSSPAGWSATRSCRRGPGGQLACVNRAVILHNSVISRHAVVENAILDKNVVVQEGAAVGVDKEHDRARGLVVSSGGITVVGKGQVVAP